MNRRMAGSKAHTLSAVLVLALLVLVSGFASAQPRIVSAYFIELAKLTAADGTTGDAFGRSLSISGDTVVVGASTGENNGTYSGSAYLFERNEGGPGNWGQVVKVTASDGADWDQFGFSVSISGDTLVVGAVWDGNENGDGAGAAYIFERDAGEPGNWGQVAKLTASDGAEWDQFGCAVSISGDTIVIGAHRDDDNGEDSGSAYVFERDAGGPGNWGQVAKLTALEGGFHQEFGWMVSVSGDGVVIGSLYASSAYVFEKSGAVWADMTESAKLTASDGTVVGSSSVSISGDTVVTGAHGDDENGDRSGSAYVFERDAGGPGNWGQVAKLTASDGAPGDEFGCAVSISGDTIVIGAHGDDDIGDNSGSAYFFDKPGTGWEDMTDTAKGIASDGAAGCESFGRPVSNSGEAAVIGCWENAAYVFLRFEPVAWVYLPVVLRNAP